MIVLRSRIRLLSLYEGKTKHTFFNNLSIGDVIEISLPIIRPQSNRGRPYVTNIRLFNCTNNMKYSNSLTIITNYLSNLTYIEKVE